MAEPVRKRRFHFKDIAPTDPAVRRFWDWLPENRGFYQDFRLWLKATSYSPASISLYGVAARQAIGLLDKPYWVIDPDHDLEQVWQHLQTRPLSTNTLADYQKGLLKLEEYLRLRCHHPPKPPKINWEYYLASLPDWLQSDLRSFALHAQRTWKPEQFALKTTGLLSSLTLSLRWIVARFPFHQISDLTPQVWDTYLDARLADGKSPVTINRELSRLKSLLYFLQERDRPICQRFLRLDFLDEGKPLPKDVPIALLQRCQERNKKSTESRSKMSTFSQTKSPVQFFNIPWRSFSAS